jgi:hypothetical protein
LQQTNDVIEWNHVINGWLGRCFATTQAVGMRRITEHKERRPTLGRLLHELAPTCRSTGAGVTGGPRAVSGGSLAWTPMSRHAMSRHAGLEGLVRAGDGQRQDGGRRRRAVTPPPRVRVTCSPQCPGGTA